MTNLIIFSLRNSNFQTKFEFSDSILVFELGLDSVFYCFFFKIELSDNAALRLLVGFFCGKVSTFLATLFSIFF